MRTFSLWASLLGLAFVTASRAETIEVDVQGLTCAFCVDSLQRQLEKRPDIEQVEVSLKTKKVRFVSNKEELDFDEIRRVVIDSGFTPIAIRVLENED